MNLIIFFSRAPLYLRRKMLDTNCLFKLYISWILIAYLGSRNAGYKFTFQFFCIFYPILLWSFRLLYLLLFSLPI
jgi:hypothetical protein